MPESLALVAELRGRRVPAVVSGAGPTVLAFVTDDAETVAALAPAGWRAIRQGVGGRGAAVLM
jgi:homoserine kinase